MLKESWRPRARKPTWSQPRPPISHLGLQLHNSATAAAQASMAAAPPLRHTVRQVAGANPRPQLWEWQAPPAKKTSRSRKEHRKSRRTIGQDPGLLYFLDALGYPDTAGFDVLGRIRPRPDRQDGRYQTPASLHTLRAGVPAPQAFRAPGRRDGQRQAGHDLLNAYRQWPVKEPAHCGTFLRAASGPTLWFHFAMCGLSLEL